MLLLRRCISKSPLLDVSSSARLSGSTFCIRPGRGFHFTACNASKHNLVFLGTPEVAAEVLQKLVHASSLTDSTFQVAAVVSQPGRPKGRGKKKVPQPSPVEQTALDNGIHSDQILCPVKANEPEFLERLGALQPDLCLTAAYGNILPKSFLSIPKFGTLNIHPSLLPKYRGAAPVQRALQDGCEETGVSVAFTVRAMDAGPILAQKKVSVDPDIDSPSLLSHLFELGTDLLLENLPDVWSGQAAQKAIPQDESQVSHAAKLSKEDGLLDFSEPARTIHNKVRAFAGWPGTVAQFSFVSEDGSKTEETVKIVKTQLGPSDKHVQQPGVRIESRKLFIHCGDYLDNCLEILQVQPTNKKVMDVASFINGLNGRTLQL